MIDNCWCFFLEGVIQIDLTIRPINPEEITFLYIQSQNDNIESGCIGFLRGDFDTSGKGFYTTWEDKVKFLKTDDFKKNLMMLSILCDSIMESF